jgi:6,7-dimethyl-8-ribityllumazine synthase
MDIQKVTPEIDVTGFKKDAKIAIVYSSWHAYYIEQIRNHLKRYLLSVGIKNIKEYPVPGSNEIPFVASKIAKEVDGILCVGILIKGDTYHFEQISNAASTGIVLASIKTGIPMMNILLSCLNFEQVEERVNGEKSTLEYVVKGLLSLIQ